MCIHGEEDRAFSAADEIRVMSDPESMIILVTSNPKPLIPTRVSVALLPKKVQPDGRSICFLSSQMTFSDPGIRFAM